MNLTDKQLECSTTTQELCSQLSWKGTFSWKIYLDWNVKNSFPVNKQKTLYVVCWRLDYISPMLFWAEIVKNPNIWNGLFCKSVCNERVNFKTLSLKHNQNYTLLLITCRLNDSRVHSKVQRGRNPDINLSGAFSFQDIISNSDEQSATQCHYNPQGSIALPVSDTLQSGHLPHPGEGSSNIHFFAN